MFGLVDQLMLDLDQLTLGLRSQLVFWDLCQAIVTLHQVTCALNRYPLWALDQVTCALDPLVWALDHSIWTLDRFIRAADQLMMGLGPISFLALDQVVRT